MLLGAGDFEKTQFDPSLQLGTKEYGRTNFHMGTNFCKTLIAQKQRIALQTFKGKIIREN